MAFNHNSEAARRTHAAAFAALAQWNHRDGAELFVKEAQKTAVELYTQTAAIAPTRAEIAADVRALGWKIPKWFHEGGARGWRFGRGKAEKDNGRKMTLEQIIAKVVRIRFNHSKFLATGWLGAIVDLRGATKASRVDHSRSGASIARDRSGVRITLWNSTDGIETMEAKAGFTSKALTVRAADMIIYIRRKMDEAVAAILRG